MSKKDGNTYGQISSQFKRCIVESPIPSEISDDFAQCQKKYRKLSTNNPMKQQLIQFLATLSNDFTSTELEGVEKFCNMNIA